MENNPEIRRVIRAFLLNEILGEGSAEDLMDSTPLISGGILDSVSVLQFVSFLEKEFHIEFQPEEVDQDNLNTIDLVAQFVQTKKN